MTTPSRSVPAPAGSGLDEPLRLPSGDLLIAGSWVPAASGARREQLDPSTARPLASVAMGGPPDIEAAIAAATDASAAWRAWPASRRRDVLLEVARLIDQQDHELAILRSLETGAPMKRKRGQSLAAEWTRYYAGWVDKIEGSTAAPYGAPALSYTLPEPYGVIAVLTPWNGGMVSAAMKVVPALAAGNTVVLKPSELAALGPLRFAELCQQAGLPAGVLNVVTGGPDAGAALVGDPRIGKISFTGGGATARRIVESSARTLTPVVLELGGKSAQLVFPDADLDLAAMTVVQACLANISGQGCVLPTRLLVHDAVYDRVASAVATAAGAIRIGRPFDDGVSMGPVIDATQCERILGVIDRARSTDAGILLTGGERIGGALSDGYFIAPTVFGDVDPYSDLAQHEVFGPVLAMMRFSDEEEALALANSTPYGLGGLVYTRDIDRAHRVAHRLRAGYVGINAFPPMPPNAPFGGVKQSGYGREGGREGLFEFLQTKNVFVGLSS